MKDTDIKVFSRANVENFLTDLPHIVISISEPETPGYPLIKAKLPDNPNRIAELYLDFCDMDCRKTKAEDMPACYKLFSEEDARSILKFVKLTEQYINLIVVNCPGGVSRSSGVAAALSLLIGYGDARFFDPKGPYTPNRWVYRTLINVAVKEGFYAPPS